jgi:hypothetical protein
MKKIILILSLISYAFIACENEHEKDYNDNRNLDDTPGLIASFMFSGNIHDSSIMNNTTDFFGEIPPLFVEDRFMQPNNSLSFDGNDDFFCGHTGFYDSLSVSFWMHYQIVKEGESVVLLDYGNKGLMIELDAKTGATCLLKPSCNSEPISISDYYPNTNIGWNETGWYHIYMEGGYSTPPLIYVNGIKKSIDGDKVKMHAANDKVYIGRLCYYLFSDKKYFKGFIDDLKIYKRKLTEEEIVNLYN